MNIHEVIHPQERRRVMSKIKSTLNENYNGTLIYLTVSGSHVYGFSSPESDIDYRGCFLAGEENFLGFLNMLGNREIRQSENKLDIVLYEIDKEIELALKSNCSSLERINGPLLFNTSEFLELREKLNSLMNKRGLYYSYKNMATSNYEKFIRKKENPTYKKYLYIFRALMSLTYVLENHEILTDMNKLNERFRIDEIDYLLEQKKKAAKNREVLGELDKEKLDGIFFELKEIVDKAYIESTLPVKVKHEEIKELNDWVVSLRLDRMRKNILGLSFWRQ